MCEGIGVSSMLRLMVRSVVLLVIMFPTLGNIMIKVGLSVSNAFLFIRKRGLRGEELEVIRCRCTEIVHSSLYLTTDCKRL